MHLILRPSSSEFNFPVPCLAVVPWSQLGEQAAAAAADFLLLVLLLLFLLFDSFSPRTDGVLFIVPPNSPPLSRLRSTLPAALRLSGHGGSAAVSVPGCTECAGKPGPRTQNHGFPMPCVLFV